MVAADIAHAAPEPTVTELRFRFAPDAPIEKSNLRVNADVRIEPHVVGLPVATAFAPVIAFSVSVPAEDAGAIVAEHASVTIRTCAPIAVSASVGWVPSYHRITALAPT